STLVNRILGEERMIASDVPGTTRDSIAVDLERDGRKYRLIDTAGLRRKSRVEAAVEKFSIIKTLQAIEECQVAVILLDASEGVTEQDASVLGAVLDAGRALVIAINKWDGLSSYQREQTEALLSRRLAFVPWAESVRIRVARAVPRHPARPCLGHAHLQHLGSDARARDRLRVQPAAGGARSRPQAAFRPPGRRQSAHLRRPRQPPADLAGQLHALPG